MPAARQRFIASPNAAHAQEPTCSFLLVMRGIMGKCKQTDCAYPSREMIVLISVFMMCVPETNDVQAWTFGAIFQGVGARTKHSSRYANQRFLQLLVQD